ncbi:hypothetical protein GCM10009740_11510 [Terrabacter terrae]|uniref:Uncharacterized protein n=1 Tax=Terrabacter terrae TaxID=318434 RepID=A0ABP5FCR5_9MICO
MAPHAERRVDVHGARTLEGRGQQLEDPVAHHRDVSALCRSSVAHGASLALVFLDLRCLVLLVDRARWPRPVVRTCGLVPIRCLARDGGSRPGSGAAGGRLSGAAGLW